MKPDRVRAEDCATVWFATLERSRLTNDYEQAAEAIRELRRLGYNVRVDPKATTAEAVPC